MSLPFAIKRTLPAELPVVRVCASEPHDPPDPDSGTSSNVHAHRCQKRDRAIRSSMRESSSPEADHEPDVSPYVTEKPGISPTCSSPQPMYDANSRDSA